MTTLILPQFPNQPIYIGYFTDISPDVLATVKKELMAGNSEYDFCFLNTDLIVSLEQLLASLLRSILEWKNGTMKTKTFNTLVMYNLSASNNVGDALRRFGVDPECPRVIVVKLMTNEDDSNQISNHLSKLLGTSSPQTYTDESIWKVVDLAKVKRTYKLTESQIKDPSAQNLLTRLTIAAGCLRGC